MGLLRLLRRFPRVRLDAPVALCADGRPVLAQAMDVSEGGLGLVTALAPPAPDTVITCQFMLPGFDAPIEATGRISHHNGAARAGAGPVRFGVVFVMLSVESRRNLKRYINMRRFLHGDLRAPSDNPVVGERMQARLGRVRRQDELA